MGKHAKKIIYQTVRYYSKLNEKNILKLDYFFEVEL